METVRAMLDEDPYRVNQDDEHQWKPVFHAALQKHLEVVQLLIDRGADLAIHDGYVMHYAAQVKGNKKVVRLLMQYGALDAHTLPASQVARQFIYAVFMGNASRVHSLLQVEPGLVRERYARGDTALHHACRNGNQDVVQILVESAADVNSLSESHHFPLYCAAGHGHQNIAVYLLNHGADINLTLEDGQDILTWLQQYQQHQPYGRILKALLPYR